MSDAARDIRARLDNALALCSALGMRIAPRASARQATVACPWHDERTPSCVVRLAKDGTIAVRCHACGATGDALSLVAQVQGLSVDRDFAEILRRGAELAGAPGIIEASTPRKKTHAPGGQSDETYDRIAAALLAELSPMRHVAPHVAAYLDARGVFADAEAVDVRGLPRDARALVASLLAGFEREELDAAGILRRGRDELDWPAWALLIPWRDRFGRIVCMQRRRLDEGRPKYRFPPGRAPRAPFGVEFLGAALESFGPSAEVVIVEGAIDTLARRRIASHRRECCAVIGCASASTPCVGLPLDVLKGRRVVLALDADPAGEAACAELGAVLAGVASEFVRERPKGSKDWAAQLWEASA
jgi:DNA primase